MTVNENYCCEFNHRVPLDQADEIYIYGDVILRQVIVTQRKNLDTMFNVNDPVSLFTFISRYIPLMLIFIHKKAIPFVSRLERNLLIGSEIHVYGRVSNSGR